MAIIFCIGIKNFKRMLFLMRYISVTQMAELVFLYLLKHQMPIRVLKTSIDIQNRFWRNF